MKKGIAALLVTLLIICGCGYVDSPPEASTPEPPAHNGTFVSDYGTMIFDGDGESVTVCFEDSFADEAGLPKGSVDGTYCFQFHNGMYRYDKAESFHLYIGGTEYQFMNDFTETNEKTISLVSPVDAADKMVFVAE